MTIPEEIEQLKAELGQISDLQEEEKLLLAILDKYALIFSADGLPYAERLTAVAEKTNNQHSKAVALLHAGNINRLTGKYEVALNLLSESLLLFEKAGDIAGMGRVYNGMGAVHTFAGNYPLALENHTKALKIWEETGNKKGIATSFLNMGVVNDEMGNYPEALNSFFRALRINEELGHEPGIANTYSNIGAVYKALKNPKEAIKYSLLAIDIRKAIGAQHGLATAYDNVGLFYAEDGRYDEALKYHMLAIKIRQELDDKFGLAQSYNGLGFALMGKAGHPDTSRAERAECYAEALKSYLSALQFGQEAGAKMTIATSYMCLGDFYSKQGSYAEAIKNFESGMQISEEMGMGELVKSISKEISNAFKLSGDFESALKYHEKYHEVESKILGEQSQKQITNLSFMHNLEQKEKDLEIEQLRNVELKKERDRSESLLLNILPSEVAEELKSKGTADAKLFDDVTVLFTDFKSFTKVSERLTPQQLVDELHTCFSAFDHIISKYNIEKIKTVGDAYLAAAGLPSPNPSHADDLVNAALEIKAFMLNRHKELGDKTFEVRIGIHSGPVVAGIVGVKKFAYDIWGDTVNTAARMEQNSEAGKINISQTTYELVKDKFNCTYRGEIEAKNKGLLRMYFVE